MSATPRLKKSETLEIRLPYPTKLAFMARCRDQGRSASEALRQFIDGQIDGTRPSGPSNRAWRLIAGAAVGAAMAAVAVPSLAHPSLRAEFVRLDLNGDHVVTTAEFARLDANHDGKITLEEFRAALPRR
jgi:hypothetical protein